MLSTIIFQMAVRTVKQMDRLEQRAGRAIALAVSAGPFDLGKFFSTGEISLTLRGKGGVFMVSAQAASAVESGATRTSDQAARRSLAS